MRDHQATHKQAHRGADKPLQLAALRISRRSSKQLQIPAVPDDLSDDEAEVRVRPPRKSEGAGGTINTITLYGINGILNFHELIHEKLHQVKVRHNTLSSLHVSTNGQAYKAPSNRAWQQHGSPST